MGKDHPPEQIEIGKLLRSSPSLKRKLTRELLADAYRDGAKLFVMEY
jgi:hypothetical protein